MISDKKFIELLNLYLDHEISAEEVRVLEAEILSKPDRYTLYRQYCAMHKGCLELASAFAPQSEVVAAARKATSARELAKSASTPEVSPLKLSWGAWVGGLGLAAACGALAFFVFSHKHHPVPAAGGVPAPLLLAAPLSAPLSTPTSSPAGSAPHFAGHTGQGHLLLSGQVGEASPAQAVLTTVTERPATAAAPVAQRLHHIYSPGFFRSHSATPSAFPALYTAGSTTTEREHWDWGPLVDLREVMEAQSMQAPFQVRPAVAPSPRVYRRQERRFEGGRVEMLHFQFQR